MKSIENTQVAINCAALLSLLTVIGQYTSHLIHDLHQILFVYPSIYEDSTRLSAGACCIPKSPINHCCSTRSDTI